jgi:hypothetical protein
MFIYVLLLFIAVVAVCFIFYLFSLMQLMPLYITAPALFLSILITVQFVIYSTRSKKQFKGYKN